MQDASLWPGRAPERQRMTRAAPVAWFMPERPALHLRGSQRVPKGATQGGPKSAEGLLFQKKTLLVQYNLSNPAWRAPHLSVSPLEYTLH
jgi:hypothetical protein